MLRFVFLLLLATAAGSTRAATPSSDRKVFPHSIHEVPGPGAPSVRHHPQITRAALLASENAAPIDFEIALGMRNFAELQARIARGEIISRAELEAKYLPTADDYTRVANWAAGQGLTVRSADSLRLAVYAGGTVAQVSQALQTSFARVAIDGQEFSSAVTSPSLPTEIADAVVGIHGLQPHIRPHHLLAAPPSSPAGAQASNSGFIPSQIATAYNATGFGLTGTGQTIAIFDQAIPAQSDITNFWAQAGVGGSVNNITYVPINGGAAIPADSLSTEEATLDVEWASGIAPGAAIRVYDSNLSDEAAFDETYQQIYNDLPAYPGIHQLSISYGYGERDVDQDYFTIEGQYFAVLASAGVTVFAASGDYGAYADGTNVLEPSYPGEDPDVTGVGGTSLTLTASNTIATETAWSGSGGGISLVIPRPAWQTGPGVISGSTRLTPDVAAVADPDTGAMIYFSGHPTVIGGTSWATPVWAAFCSMLNQSRANAGQPPLGLLNPKIYVLNGSSDFHDITSGSNGTYQAGTGYDLVTGVGSPDFGNLLQVSLNAAQAPEVMDELGNRFVTLGQAATFAVAANGYPAPSYQWQRLPGGTGSWTNLSDSTTYSGSKTDILIVSGATSAMNGDQFRCVVTNPAGSAASTPAALTVNATGVTTFAGWATDAGTTNGTGSAARFNEPGGIRVDSSGNIYVADGGNSTIRKITPAAVVTTLLGQPGVTGSANGPVASATIDDPGGVAIDSAGNVYVADTGNYTIRKYTLSTGQVTTLAGSAGISKHVNGMGSAARFTDPENLAVDGSGNIYVADGKGNTIRLVTPAGAVTTIAGDDLNGASGLTDGQGTAARFNNPVGIIVSPSGTLYVADAGNNAIRQITSAGYVSTLAGGHKGSSDGTGTAAQFNTPSGVAVDSSGNVYVADNGNDLIREVTTAGVVTTIAGLGGTKEDIDGLGTSARFWLPADVAFDPSGNLFIADSDNDTVRRFALAVVGAPTITTQPSSETVVPGETAIFSVVAGGPAPLSYQWQSLASGGSSWTTLSDGTPYSGSATSTLTVSEVPATLNGTQYRCIVTNGNGNVTSNSATLLVGSAPAITTNPASQTVVAGASVTLSVAASGSDLQYLWFFNSTAISGATGSSYTIGNFQAASAGTYTVQVSDSFGTVTSAAAVLMEQSIRLVNLSILSDVTSSLSMGFVLGGDGTSGSENLLIRAVGPSIGTGTAFNVPNVLPDPTLTIVQQGGSALDSNAGWGVTAGNVAAVESADNATGAFPLTDTMSKDSAVVVGLPAGGYSVQVAGKSNDSGEVLTEVYDDTLAANYVPGVSLRPINLSSLLQVAPGGTVDVGFVIGGTGSETLLIRAVGPGLAAAPFDVPGTMPDPQLVITPLSSGSTILAQNAGWAGNSQVVAAEGTTGAFALSPSSADSATVFTVSSSQYTQFTIQVSSVSGVGGWVLVEIYEVPPGN